MKSKSKPSSAFQHGGKRPGAGRKPKADAMVTRSVCLPPKLWKRLDLERGSASRGEFLRRKLFGIAAGKGIPIVGAIPAGSLQRALGASKDRLPFPPKFFHGRRLFSLRVRGEGLKSAGISDGDWAVLQSQSTLRHGEIVAVLLSNKPRLRRVFKVRGGYSLRTENPHEPPIHIRHDERHFQIAGKLIGIVRKCA